MDSILKTLFIMIVDQALKQKKDVLIQVVKTCCYKTFDKRKTYCVVIPILLDMTLTVGYGCPAAFLPWKQATLRNIITDLYLFLALLQAGTGRRLDETVFHKRILRDFLA